MARIRSAKPEFWTDPKMGALKRDVRFTFKGIWEVCADDEGRFLADARIVKGQVWPLDDDITPKKIDQWLQLLASAPVRRIVLYEVDGARYGWIPTWHKHQKISHPTPSKLPPPPRKVVEEFGRGSGDAPESLRQYSGDAPEGFRPDVEEDVDRDVEVEGDTTSTARVREALPEPYRADFDRLLERVGVRASLVSELEALHSGMHPPAYSWEEIGLGIHDLVLAGKHERPSARQIRRYVEGARENLGHASAGAALPDPAAAFYALLRDHRLLHAVGEDFRATVEGMARTGVIPEAAAFLAQCRKLDFPALRQASAERFAIQHIRERLFAGGSNGTGAAA